MILRTENLVAVAEPSTPRARRVTHSPEAWLLLAALLMPVAAACGSDDDDSGSPGGGAGSGASAATLTQVAAIFEAKNCGTCHMAAPSTVNGGLQFDPKNKASIAALVGKSSTGSNGSMCSGMMYIVAGQPNSSLLYKKLTATPGCGMRMPQGGTPLSETELSTVGSWITGGAPNN